MADFQPGVFFGMSEEDYHAIPALSASMMKDLKVSTLNGYVHSPHNPDRQAVVDEESSSEARSIGRAFHKRICEGREPFSARYAEKLEQDDHPNALSTIDDLKTWLRLHDLPLTGKKDELEARILATGSSVQIWSQMADLHAQKHDGKTFLSAKWISKIEIAAAMIESHPQLSKAFSGGVPEVSIFWRDETVGVNCKARLDYLKARAVVDLKTLTPMPGMPLSRAVALEFARRHYSVQAAFYLEAASKVSGFIKEGLSDGKSPDYDPTAKALSADHPKGFLFVFQVKGVAPAALGRTLPPQLIAMQAAQAEIDSMKQTYRACLEKFGNDPWVEDTAIEAFADEDFPSWSLT